MIATATGGTIEIDRELAATCAAVHRRWTEPSAMARWFAPPGYATIASAADPRPGGAWQLGFRSEDGSHEYVERGEYREVEPGRIVLTLTQVDPPHRNPETLVTVELEDIGTAAAPRTRMRFRQSGYRSIDQRLGNEQGWQGCFDALAEDVAAGADSDLAELRDLFTAWFDASERKDLDGSMAPIAAEIVSYEHEAPQQYQGAEAVRDVCARGFDYQPEKFRWDIPDLRIEVAGDLAVAWGLNRMSATLADGTVRTDWSRGTRVFRRRHGSWQMVHQHVSFPIDEHGVASTVR